MGGGFSAVDMALHDIAGKVYNVPAYRLLGAQVRDRIRIYGDTTDHKDPKVYAERMRRRTEMGITFFKMDLHTALVADRPGAVNERGVATEKGLGYLCEYIQAIRDTVGWGVPLAADHFGPLNVKDAIRYARAFEKYQLSWAEDMVPWPNWQGLKEIKAIVEIQVKKLQQRLLERRIDLKMTETAKEWLAKEGFDPSYGARPLKRVIQREIQDQLAMKILEGKFKEGDAVVVDLDGKKGELVFRA